MEVDTPLLKAFAIIKETVRFLYKGREENKVL